MQKVVFRKGSAAKNEASILTVKNIFARLVLLAQAIHIAPQDQLILPVLDPGEAAVLAFKRERR
ncbi:MAG: hypothetical protein KDE15_00820 [Erythrobacter sp.]|nr:hypothetical protein [Erythrobacter sp.]